MRRVLACLVVALAVPAGAGATSMPPFRGVQALIRYTPVAASPRRASCSEQGHTQKVARLAKKLAPVACEQPPKPKLRDTTPGVFLAP